MKIKISIKTNNLNNKLPKKVRLNQRLNHKQLKYKLKPKQIKLPKIKKLCNQFKNNNAASLKKYNRVQNKPKHKITLRNLQSRNWKLDLHLN